MRNTLRKQNNLKDNTEFQDELVTRFVKIFIDINERNPTENEIMNNLKDKISPSLITGIIVRTGCLGNDSGSEL